MSAVCSLLRYRAHAVALLAFACGREELLELRGADDFAGASGEGGSAGSAAGDAGSGAGGSRAGQGGQGGSGDGGAGSGGSGGAGSEGGGGSGAEGGSGGESGSGAEGGASGASGASGAGSAGGSSGTSGSGGSGQEGGSGATSGSGGASGEGGNPCDGGSSGRGGEGTFASDLILARVEFNQGVAVQIARDSAPIPPADRQGDFTAARGGLLRAFWVLGPEFVPRNLEARLTLVYPDGSERVKSFNQEVEGPPDAGTLGAALDWVLDSEDVVPGVRYSIGVFETEPGAVPPGADMPRMPKCGAAELGVSESAMRLEITFVPLVMQGRSPDLSEANVRELTNGYYNMNPVSEVLVTVHAPLTFDGTAMASALSEVSLLRAAEQAPPEMYYIGLAPVAATGWVGVSYRPGSEKGGDRSSVSAISDTPGAFPADDSWGFVVHETGHAQGLRHNPGCNAPAPNGAWPYADSKINVDGFDLRRSTLYGAQVFEDYMNYCVPNWPSDFTWWQTARRIRVLSGWQRAAPAAYDAYVLKGLVPSTGDPVFWAQEGSSTTSHPFGSATRVEARLSDGSVVVLPAAQEFLDDAALWAFDAILPTHPRELRQATAYVGGEAHVLDPQRLMTRFERLVRSR